MSLNVENLNKLIAHLEAQPPERFNIKNCFSTAHGKMSAAVLSLDDCGTAACIAGHCAVVAGLPIGSPFDSDDAEAWLGLPRLGLHDLFMPPDYWVTPRAYPLSRALRTLYILRDTYLRTGEIVVDWGPEPGEEPAQTWSAPQAVEVVSPVLPESLTRILSWHDRVVAEPAPALVREG